MRTLVAAHLILISSVTRVHVSYHSCIRSSILSSNTFHNNTVVFVLPVEFLERGDRAGELRINAPEGPFATSDTSFGRKPPPHIRTYLDADSQTAPQIMVRSTIIVRASDALPLAASVDDEQVFPEYPRLPVHSFTSA